MYRGTIVPMTDEEFLAALERCALPADAFTHAAHLRAGYLYLRARGFDSALGQMRGAVQRYAAHLGKPEKYHETITVAYLALINERLSERGDAGDWASFQERNPDLFERDLLLRHYRRSELESDLARQIFILPRRAGRERGLSAVEKGILHRHRAPGVDADDILGARRHHHDAVDERAKHDTVAGFRHGFAPL